MSARGLREAGVYLVGPGRLGLSLALAFRAADIPLAGVAYHSTAGRDRAALALGKARLEPLTAPTSAASAALIVVAVSDEAIPAAGAALVGHRRPGQVIVHTAGLLTAEVLRAAGLDEPVGSFHPLQTFADPGQGPALLAECVVALEGDPPAVAAGRELALALGAEPIALRSEAKVAYHAAAAVASNYLVVLTGLAARLAELADLDEATAIEMLFRLQSSTLANLRAFGVAPALTGPIARGDVATVRAHLALIDVQAPDLGAIYRLLGRHALVLARARGLEEDRLTALASLLA